TFLSPFFHYSFFFLLLLCIPCSTLFPYTTLFRSSLYCKGSVITFVMSWKSLILTEFIVEFKVYSSEEMPVQKIKSKICIHVQIRSEEHTSELQSRFDLVCRLLLEKKNVLNN